MKYEEALICNEMILHVETRVLASLPFAADDLEKYLAYSLDGNLSKMIGEKIADGREYIVKILDTHSELYEYGHYRTYHKEAIVALRNLRDAKPGDAVWVTDEEDERYSKIVASPMVFNIEAGVAISDYGCVINTNFPYKEITITRTKLCYKDETYRFWICKA